MNVTKWQAMIIRAAKLLSVLGEVVLFAVMWKLTYAYTCSMPGLMNGGIVIAFFYAATTFMMNRIYNAYDLGTARVGDMVYSLSLSNVVCNGIAYVVIMIGYSKFLSVLPILSLIVAQAIWNFVWSLAVNRLYMRWNKPHKTAIVYASERDLVRIREIESFKGRFDVVKYVRQPENMDQLKKQIGDCSVVFALGLPSALLSDIAKYCILANKQAYIDPQIGDVVLAGAEHMHMFSVPVIRVRSAYLTPEYVVLKRLIDVVASLAGIVVTSPVMLITALAIKLYDGGPVFYKQVRLTKGGRKFNILKFRSMSTNAEQDGVARLAAQNDDRITPVGKLIRACRIDELPQLFNILLGDMTIVGPRPERPEIAAQYEKEMPEFRCRLQVKAGLTGLAQIFGRYNTEPYDKLRMDLMYINNMSIVEDLRLMFATVKILFMKESTAGVQEGQVTAVNDKKSA